MSTLPTEKLELLLLRQARMEELFQSSIRRRWGSSDWQLLFPWWREPTRVRILMYADGDVRFSELQYVKTLLESHAYFYVDFDITTAHREGDPLATIKIPVDFTDLDILDSFDEVWLFGFNSTPPLPKEEVDLINQFMAAPKCGGVLVTGDHSNLGQALAGSIPRAGKMRSWSIDATGPARHSTLEEGPDENLLFNDEDQSDDRPQKIRCTHFPFGSPLAFRTRLRPHPVLCGPDGPIDVLPDHQHEGEALAPEFKPGDPEWPANQDGYQEKPYVIACGETKDPEINCKKFGVVSAYNGHNVDVGRIVADSSWHHWLNTNLTGINVPPHYLGFEATPEGRAALKKIDTYFLNCGVWLAPPRQQQQMSNVAWWSVVWTDRTVEIPQDAPLWYFGEQALGALGRYASVCAVSDWALGSPTFKDELPRWKLQEGLEQFPLFNIAVEQYVAGGILNALMRKVGPFNPKLHFPLDAPEDEILEAAIESGTKMGLEALRTQLTEDAKILLALMTSSFHLT